MTFSYSCISKVGIWLFVLILLICAHLDYLELILHCDHRELVMYIINK